MTSLLNVIIPCGLSIAFKVFCCCFFLVIPSNRKNRSYYKLNLTVGLWSVCVYYLCSVAPIRLQIIAIRASIPFSRSYNTTNGLYTNVIFVRVYVCLSYTHRAALCHSTCLLLGLEGRVLYFKVNEKRSLFQVKLKPFYFYKIFK